MKTNCKLIPLVLAAIAVFFMAGCAGTSENLGQSPSLQPAPGKGLVILYCGPGILGSAAKYHVWADNQLLTKVFKRGSYVYCQAAPGILHLTYEQNMNAGAAINCVLCPPIGVAMVAGTMIKNNAPLLNIEPGQTYYVKLGTSGAQVVPRDEAIEELQKCRMITPIP